LSQQRVVLNIDTSGRRSFPANLLTTALQVAQPVVINKIPLQQLLGTFSGTVSVDIAALAANVPADTTFTCQLATNPNNPRQFTINRGNTGLIQATCALQQTSDPTTIFGMPVLSLTFGTGLPQVAGSGVWALRPAVQYQAATLNATVRAFSPTGAPAQTVSFLVQGQLIGISPVSAGSPNS
jgi:hypothetical protein